MMNKEMIVPVRTIGDVRGKLEYLDRLTRLHGFLDNTDKRIDRLCNSIEKDLGLNGDDDEIKEEEAGLIKGGIVTKPGVSGVGRVND